MADSGPDATRVLKVAVDDAAAGRIAGEAGVLAGLNDPRLVRLVEGPVEVGGRQALVLESAGDETLGEVLRGRERLSLDLLERWGTDLLEALVALDRAGVDHRDIKPANLGVREGRSDRAKHLVLFDFSLSRAGAAAVTAGTPPYLDPVPRRPRTGAVRLGRRAVLRRGGAVRDGHRGGPEVRRRAVRPGVGPRRGHHRGGHVRPGRGRGGWSRSSARRWPAAPRNATTPPRRCSPPGGRCSPRSPRPSPTTPTNAPPRRNRPTPLAEAGLSARALSALEPYGVVTVGDLVAVDPVRLNRLSGVAEATRREVKARARQWRDKFGSAVTGRGPGRQNPPGPNGAGGPDPVAAAELLAGPRGDGAGRVAAGHGPAAPRARPGPRPLRQPDTSWPRRSA